jgi:MFS family permease
MEEAPASAGGFRRVAFAGTISPLGDAMAMLALILYVQAKGRSGFAVGMLLFADAFGPLLSPVAGSLADRIDRRLVMVATCLGQAALVGVMALVLPAWPVMVVLAFGRSVLGALFAPAMQASIPDLVADAGLNRANALLAGARELGTVVGPPVAGWLWPALGAHGVLIIDAVTFVLAAAALAGLPSRRSGVPVATTPGMAAGIVEGGRYMWSDPRLRALTVGFWCVVLFSGADDLVLPFLGREVLHTSPLGVGTLLAGASIGLIGGLGAIALSRRSGGQGQLTGSEFGLVLAVLLGLAGASLGNLLTAPAPNLGGAVGAQVLRGVGLALVDANVQTFLQRRTPRAMLGRVMGNLWGGVGVAAALSYALGGPLLDATSPRVMFLLIGGGGLLATVLAAPAALRRAPTPPTT